MNKVATDFSVLRQRFQHKEEKHGRDSKYRQHQEAVSQHQNEAETRNQVKWRQNSIATNFLGRDRNSDNTRNSVAIRTKTEMLS